MSGHDDSNDDELTPPHQCAPLTIDDQSSGLTDSQRDWHAARFASKVPVVEPREVPTLSALVARTTTPDELEVLRHFRIAGDKTAMAEFLVKVFADLRALRQDFNRKLEGDSSDNEQQAAELRALLERPPNGRVKALQERVDALERSLHKDEVADAKADVADESRLKLLEGNAQFAKRAAQGVIVFLLVTIGAGGIWVGATNEKLNNVIDAVKAVEKKVDGLIRWSQPKDSNTP